MENPLILLTDPVEGSWLNIVDAATLDSCYDHIREEYLVGQNSLQAIQRDDLEATMILELRSL